MAKKASNRDSLIVASKVREYIKSEKLMTSGELLEALSEAVYGVLDKAMARTRDNKRSTVRAHDL
jgi:histone H3/H4